MSNYNQIINIGRLTRDPELKSVGSTQVCEEIRLVMIERLGLEKYLLESGAEELDKSVWGTLYKKNLPNDEPIVTVHVLNSTPEPDGSIKRYMLRVQPELRPMLPDGSLGEPQKMTARNAVASTFGKRGDEYNPVIQS